MSNPRSNGGASKQSKAFSSLQKEIEQQKHKVNDVHQKNNETAMFLSKLKDSLKTVMEMANKEDTQREECDKELRHMKFLISKMSHDMECVKKEHEQITKELEESKSLNELQLKKFTEETRKNLKQISSLKMAVQKQTGHTNVSTFSEDLKGQTDQLNAKIVELEKQLESKQEMELENQQLQEKLDVMEHMEGEFLKMVADLHINVAEKERALQALEEYSQALTVKERESNDELQKTRKRMIEGIAGRPSRGANIVVKRMGQVDSRPFYKALYAKRKYSKEEVAERAAEMCSVWENNLKDPHWYPFKIITFRNGPKEIINEEDAKLKRLKMEMGVGPFKAVVTALTEMNEYNPSGRYVVSELWNRSEERRATLEEGVELLFEHWKVKKQKIHQTGTADGENADNDNEVSPAHDDNAASPFVGKGV
ncbi:factor of DNA methylation 1-like [Lotus japonicus]|uniref:factor of DNA methylation 1-like n=1 Tax=Lotus japonicus TaxID=34305 RepID=UPI00258F6D19|nr:factor of DNA methylation 1-like [Lotus japonicus]